MLPSFPYDTTAREEGRIQVDSQFFEAWADTLVCGGWARDELKESSFALIQWKSRPRISESAGAKTRVADSDGRTEDRWFLVEEFVPKEYRDQLKEQKVGRLSDLLKLAEAHTRHPIRSRSKSRPSVSHSCARSGAKTLFVTRLKRAQQSKFDIHIIKVAGPPC
jgi:hypothetical protein